MNLQDLPTELFCQIVHDLVGFAKIRHAWNLRGVSRTFAAAIKYDVLAKQSIASFSSTNSHQLLQNFGDIWLVNRLKAPLDANLHAIARLKEMIDFLAQELEIGEQQLENFEEQFCVGYKNVADISCVVDAFSCQHPHCCWISQSVDTHDKLSASLIIGNYELIKKLLPALEIKERPELFRFSPFKIAISQSDETLLGIILEYLESLRSTDPDAADRIELTRPSYFALSTKDAICFAIKQDNLDFAQTLLDFHAKNFPSASSSTWNEWFETAVYHKNGLDGKPSMNNFLGAVLDYAAGRHAKKPSRGTMKHIFAYGTRAMVDEVLSRRTTDVNAGTVLTLPLCIAIRAGSQQAVDAVLDAGADINITFASNRRSTPKNQERPLDLAIHDHDLGIIKLLVNRGAIVPHSSE